MMTVQAKICGVSTPATLDAAIKHGASHVGLVFFAKSPRNLDAARAGALASHAAGRVRIVGLFVDPDDDLIANVRQHARIDVIQLHGDETPEQTAMIRARHMLETWKAAPVRTRADLDDARAYRGAADRILYDAKPPTGADLPGGNGLRFDWDLLVGHAHPLPWALSGGLDAHNVAEAVRVTGADLVDISSGVESAPGIKDVDKIAAFLKASQL